MMTAMNVNNVLSSFYNIPDLSLNVNDLCWPADGGI